MPAKKSNFTATEIKAGVMVLASLLVLVAFVAAIRGCGSGREKSNRFSADFTSINGLNQGADVRFGGVKAGKVVEKNWRTTKIITIADYEEPES